MSTEIGKFERVLLRYGDIIQPCAYELEVLRELKEQLFSIGELVGSVRDGEIPDNVRREALAQGNKLFKHTQTGILDDVSSRLVVFPYAGEVERLKMSSVVQTLRDVRTGMEGFRNGIARAYRMLFDAAYDDEIRKRESVVATRVAEPHLQVAGQEVAYNPEFEDVAICVLLRGALYPSLVLGKEIEEKTGQMPEYELFRIKRSHTGKEQLEYILDKRGSHFDIGKLDGKNLIFPDPMLATAGSLIAIYNLIKQAGVKPASMKFFGAMGALEGVINAARNIPDMKIYLAWLDPVLNDKGYICPGFGDAGDLLNGDKECISDLIYSYGEQFCEAHKKQVEAVRDAIIRKAG